MRGAAGKDLLRTIHRTLGRFLAILAIIALGSGFLAGLRCTKSAMLATAQQYVDEQALFDFRVLNTYGWTREDVLALETIPGIGAAEGTRSLDLLVNRENREGDVAVRLLQITKRVSVPRLQAGRMPVQPGECLADGYVFSARDIGSTFLVAESNKEATLDQLAVRELKVVGLASSPLFMNFERGSTSVGNGSLSAFLYVPEATFAMEDVYTEIQLKLDENYPIYSDAYEARLEELTPLVEEKTQDLAQARYETLEADARAALTDGQREYDDGMAEYRREESRAKRELEEALKELENGKAVLEENEQKLKDGEKALADGEARLERSRRQLESGEKQLEEQKKTAQTKFAEAEAELNGKMAEAQAGKAQLEEGMALIQDGIDQIDDGLRQIEDGMSQIDVGILLANSRIGAARDLLLVVEAGLGLAPNDPTLLASKARLESQIAAAEEEIAGYNAQKEELRRTMEPLQSQRSTLVSQLRGLEAQLAQVNSGIAQIQAGQQEVASQKQQLEDNLAAVEAQLADSRRQLEAGERTLVQSRQELEEGRKALTEGWSQWNQGIADYNAARKEAEDALEEARTTLASAKEELDEGWQALRDMSPASSYVLDRTTNVAYVCFESDADIVAGVSKIFPWFFFAVAALVCLTTMSKMVDEERTQIGVKKALGYSSLAISAKYLIYSGAAALAGCLLGVSLGSVIFPKVIWMGYGIMYNFVPTVTLAVDVPLCILIVVSFTLMMLAVTWFCCWRELDDVPAELIRPKAPKAGKRLLLERLFFWDHLSFLRKVSIRNIFRYQKRLIMMLVGVGGCTALVVTGLGLGDTIVGIAETQFTQVTVYDMSVNFGEPQTQEDMNRFRERLEEDTEGIRFCHSSTVDLSFENGTKSLNLLAVEDNLEGFFDLHMGSASVPFPGPGETIINNGLSRSMGIGIGDTVTVRNADMEELTLQVTGIFENAVYNYVLVSQETLRTQWGHEGSWNYALVNAAEGADVHTLSAAVSRQRSVVNVTVSRDMMTRVANMLDSMKYIVAMVIVCAAALAFIVMYNLTNINITERVREIATIKVLGFYAAESAAYVFREGLALTIFGSLAGLLGGKYLHAFVIDKIRIDMVYFAPRVDTGSYVLSIALTLLFALLVDLALYFKLESINMAEALKSVE